MSEESTVRKLLGAWQLEPEEVDVVIGCWKAERRSTKYPAGRFADGLVKRGLVRRDRDSLRLSAEWRERIATLCHFGWRTERD